MAGDSYQLTTDEAELVNLYRELDTERRARLVGSARDMRKAAEIRRAQAGAKGLRVIAGGRSGVTTAREA